MNKLYYTALGLGLAFSISQTSSLAQVVNPWQDTQPQVFSSPAPSSQPTLNGGGQQSYFTSKQQVAVPAVNNGALAPESANAMGPAVSGSSYSFGFTGGFPSGHGGYLILPPTATSSCVGGINITGGSSMGMGGDDSGAGAVGGSASAGVGVDVGAAAGASSASIAPSGGSPAAQGPSGF